MPRSLAASCSRLVQSRLLSVARFGRFYIGLLLRGVKRRAMDEVIQGICELASSRTIAAYGPSRNLVNSRAICWRGYQRGNMTLLQGSSGTDTGRARQNNQNPNGRQSPNLPTQGNNQNQPVPWGGTHFGRARWRVQLV